MIQPPAEAAWRKAGVEILVEVKRDSVSVLRAARLDHIPRMHLHAPSVTKENLSDLEGGQTEIVLSILDSAGKELESFGMAATGRYYVDSGNPKTGTIVGGPRPIGPGEPDLRALRLPWSDEVSGLFVYRSEVVATPRGLDVQHIPIVLLHPRTGGPALSVEAMPHGLHPPEPMALPWATRWEKKPRPLPWAGAEPDPDDGTFVNATTPVQTGDPAIRFDIVITGDGFKKEELPQFDTWADTLMSGLQSMKPFSTMASLINWHRVRVASAESGIDHCPEPQYPPKRTFYQVEGCWDGKQVPGFLGTHEPGRIQWAAEQVAPWEHIDLVIIIANCNTWGGHAWPDWKTAIVPLHDHDFVNLAAHECGHVISRLAEEYISCVQEDKSWPDPNLTRFPAVSDSVLRHVGSEDQPAGGPGGRLIVRDTVWWKDLAQKVPELNRDGTFKAVHVFGDPIDPNDHKRPAVPAGQEGFVGAFWGCQNTKDLAALQRAISFMSSASEERVKPLLAVLRALLAVSAPERGGLGSDECNSYWDPRGAYYFRSSATCKMRYVTYQFCHVCQHLLMNSIRDASGVALVPPLP